MDAIIALAILIWANVSNGPKRIWQERSHTAEDALTKGWEFEAQLLLRYVLTLASGVYLATCLYSNAWNEMISAKYPSLGMTIAVLIFIPALFVFVRRHAIYKTRKRLGRTNKAMSLGYTLADGKGKIKLSRLKKES